MGRPLELKTPTEQYVGQLLSYCNDRIGHNFLHPSWTSPQADDTGINQFMKNVQMEVEQPLDKNDIEIRVRQAIARFPRRFLDEVNAACSNGNKSILFSSTLDMTETERKSCLTYPRERDSGWPSKKSHQLRINKALSEADVATLSGILFHEFSHLVLQMTKPDTTSDGIDDSNLSEDECVFLGACLMHDETKAYLVFLTECDITTEERLKRDLRLLDLSSALYSEKKVPLDQI